MPSLAPPIFVVQVSAAKLKVTAVIAMALLAGYGFSVLRSLKTVVGDLYFVFIMSHILSFIFILVNSLGCLRGALCYNPV
jgi:hypothetical protein